MRTSPQQAIGPQHTVINSPNSEAAPAPNPTSSSATISGVTGSLTSSIYGRGTNNAFNQDHKTTFGENGLRAAAAIRAATKLTNPPSDNPTQMGADYAASTLHSIQNAMATNKPFKNSTIGGAIRSGFLAGGGASVAAGGGVALTNAKTDKEKATAVIAIVDGVNDVSSALNTGVDKIRKHIAGNNNSVVSSIGQSEGVGQLQGMPVGSTVTVDGSAAGQPPRGTPVGSTVTGTRGSPTTVQLYGSAAGQPPHGTPVGSTVTGTGGSPTTVQLYGSAAGQPPHGTPVGSTVTATGGSMTTTAQVHDIPLDHSATGQQRPGTPAGSRYIGGGRPGPAPGEIGLAVGDSHSPAAYRPSRPSLSTPSNAQAHWDNIELDHSAAGQQRPGTPAGSRYTGGSRPSLSTSSTAQAIRPTLSSLADKANGFVSKATSAISGPLGVAFGGLSIHGGIEKLQDDNPKNDSAAALEVTSGVGGVVGAGSGIVGAGLGAAGYGAAGATIAGAGAAVGTAAAGVALLGLAIDTLVNHPEDLPDAPGLDRSASRLAQGRVNPGQTANHVWWGTGKL